MWTSMPRRSYFVFVRIRKNGRGFTIPIFLPVLDVTLEAVADLAWLWEKTAGIFRGKVLSKADIMSSCIRIMNACPDAPPLDVYANEKIIVRGLAYRDFTEYFPAQSGTYYIKVYPSGSKDVPVVDTSLNIPSKSILTVAVQLFIISSIVAFIDIAIRCRFRRTYTGIQVSEIYSRQIRWWNAVDFLL
ncbi:DUF4397 domain-containing protein [Pelotomaculum terephthalicicum JT]|uniref:DUF4397 domain-containing protein n=1 Tax=Pelotomaculum TaxID=191373 RepID=UPI0009CD75B0|nr:MULTISPECIES: DUF4397 domain-containing protein [Pelotomaculum]MCG9967369.1 DUF4397 domain-containing protein [Pelotomaculum terephthalicicum JT]OPX85901.1 MAG: hypothetical protein A4E54_02193 [Pelotomaculum sp. PtaB.Bin117]OPY60968.1 MAG: hypothetical protein A4E56_02346 [Pelotomaculum sp. PtaU1.Bin065]